MLLCHLIRSFICTWDVPKAGRFMYYDKKKKEQFRKINKMNKNINPGINIGSFFSYFSVYCHECNTT